MRDSFSGGRVYIKVVVYAALVVLGIVFGVLVASWR